MYACILAELKSFAARDIVSTFYKLVYEVCSFINRGVEFPSSCLNQNLIYSSAKSSDLFNLSSEGLSESKHGMQKPEDY